VVKKALKFLSFYVAGHCRPTIFGKISMGLEDRVALIARAIGGWMKLGVRASGVGEGALSAVKLGGGTLGLKLLRATLSAILIMVSFGCGDVFSATASQGGVRILSDNLFGVDFVDGKHGWVSGYYGTILRTEDGGSTWILSRITNNAHKQELVRRVSFVDSAKGWAVGHRGSVFHTVDGGVTWEVQYEQPGIYLRDVEFVDDQNGWVVGNEGTILHTQDGGGTWVKQKLTGYKGRDVPRINGIATIDRKRAVLVGEFGVVAVTQDGGNLWQLAPSGTKVTLTSVAASDPAKGLRVVAVGLDGVALEIHVDDSSPFAKIERLETNTDEALFDISLGSAGSGYAVGRFTLLRLSSDGFKAQPAGSDVGLPFAWFGGVDALPDGSAWAVGISGLVIRVNDPQSNFDVMLRLGKSTNISTSSARKEP
jgi:hypothetical protein